jgi:TonB family protein
MRLLSIVPGLVALSACAVHPHYRDFVPRDAPGPLVQLQVREIGSNAPVANALVVVGKPPNRSVSATDEYGMFVLPVRFHDPSVELVVLAPETVGPTRIVETPLAPAPLPLAEGDGLPAELQSESPFAYPLKARRLGVQGTVVLQLVIDDQGRVANATVLDGPGHGLNETAHDSVFRSLFKPASRDGKAAWSYLVYKYTFLLER